MSVLCSSCCQTNCDRMILLLNCCSSVLRICSCSAEPAACQACGARCCSWGENSLVVTLSNTDERCTVRVSFCNMGYAHEASTSQTQQESLPSHFRGAEVSTKTWTRIWTDCAQTMDTDGRRVVYGNRRLKAMNGPHTESGVDLKNIMFIKSD